MIKDIFAIKYYAVEFPDFHLFQQNLIDQITPFFEDKTKCTHRLLRNSYSIEGSAEDRVRDLYRRIEMRPLYDFISYHAKQYWDQLGYNPNWTPSITHMWSNLIPKDGNLISHNHNPNQLAGVFYVNAEAGMGDLILQNPMEQLLGRLPYYTSQESYQERYKFDEVVQARSGKLVLFPGWLNHKTQISQIDGDRLVVGMNFN